MGSKLGQCIVFARKEPTTDSATLKQGEVGADIRHCLDVVIYPVDINTPSCHEDTTRKPIARFPWYYTNKPTRRNKRVTLNGIKNILKWLPDKE